MQLQRVKATIERAALALVLLAATGAAQGFHAVAFLVPMTNRNGDNLEFYRNFWHLRYDAAFISDHYGLEGKSDEHVERTLLRILDNADRFRQETGVTPKLILDIEGFRLNTSASLRTLAEASPYVAGYHVIDEPDSHSNDDPERPDVTPDEVAAILRGNRELGPYEKPLFITFEHQAGHPDSRKWNYRNNTDELYLVYVEVINRFHEGVNYFGIDYYLYNRSLTAPDNQKTLFDMMRYFANLVKRGGKQNRAFAWTEPTFQGLEYICKNPGWKGRPAQATELWGQIWLYWVAGQRGIRGDFNYVFNHLCRGVKTWNPDGLNKNYYAQNGQQFAVQAASDIQNMLSPFLDRENLQLVTDNEMIGASLRFYEEAGRTHVLVMAVNLSNRHYRKVRVKTTSALVRRGKFEVLLEERNMQVDEAGDFVDDFRPYEAHFYLLRM